MRYAPGVLQRADKQRVKRDDARDSRACRAGRKLKSFCGIEDSRVAAMRDVGQSVLADRAHWLLFLRTMPLTSGVELAAADAEVVVEAEAVEVFLDRAGFDRAFGHRVSPRALENGLNAERCFSSREEESRCCD